MLAMRLVRLIEAHADHLSQSLTRRLENDPFCSQLRKVPRGELEARSCEIFSHLTDWLLYKTEHDLEQAYREIGVRRARQQVPLSHVLYAINATKEQLWAFLQEEGVVTKPVELFAEMELFRLLDQFFDKAIYYLAEGYESAHLAKTSVAAA
ncbi:MAG: hypothetical protein JOZ80_09115 [Acidobacteriaceae bacterium]|nr:hypothetical protein [Acidobacteriaceae bacterium]